MLRNRGKVFQKWNMNKPPAIVGENTGSAEL